MATRRTAPDPARAEQPSAPLQGLELARARAWVQERPNAGPPRISAAALADQLKAQAAEHGMADFALSASTADEAMERQQAEEDEEALKQRAEMESFAGLRPPDEGAAENPEVVALFAAQPGLVESAEALATGGAAALKAELERLGLKCGGTCEERAARLFSSALKARTAPEPPLSAHGLCAAKGLPRTAWPKGIFAKKRKGAGALPAPKRPQQGPSLPGVQRKPGTGRVGTAQDALRAAARPAGRPRGQGAGAAEKVGIWRPN